MEKPEARAANPSDKPPHHPVRLAGLDLLRLFAALMALAYHYLYRGNREGGYLSVDFGAAGDWFQYAYFGVPMFFMISGFVILWSAENKGWFEFGIGRFIRLWPAYALAVTLTALVMAAHNQAPFEASLWQWFANLTFFAPALGQPFMDGVYWTIVLEIIFYFWVTVGILTGALSRNLIVICLAWMTLILANELWLDSGALRMLGITRHGPWFLVGVLSYQLWSQGRSLITLVALAVAVELTMLTAMIEHSALAPIYNYAENFSAIVLVNAACIAVFLATIRWGNKVPATKFVFLLGGMTYPLYLLHQNIGYIAIERLAGPMGKWGAFSATTALMLIAAWAIFHYWERPVARLLKKGVAPLNALRIQLVAKTGLVRSA